jgi:hypothetical protein
MSAITTPNVCYGPLPRVFKPLKPPLGAIVKPSFDLVWRSKTPLCACLAPSKHPHSRSFGPENTAFSPVWHTFGVRLNPEIPSFAPVLRSKYPRSRPFGARKNTAGLPNNPLPLRGPKGRPQTRTTWIRRTLRGRTADRLLIPAMLPAHQISRKLAVLGQPMCINPDSDVNIYVAYYEQFC